MSPMNVSPIEGASNMRRHWLRPLGLSVLVAMSACSSGSKPGKGVSVGSPVVRSCEILLADKDQPVENVVFGEQVKGTMQRWAPKTALAFVALTDAPITGAVATVQSTSKPSFDIVTVRCYDHEGKPVASPDVHLQ